MLVLISEAIKNMKNPIPPIYHHIRRNRIFYIGLIAGIALKTIIEQDPTLIFYMIRWQLSTPSLAIVSVAYLAHKRKQKFKWPTPDEWAASALANVVGSLAFYPVDEWIFLFFKQWIK